MGDIGEALKLANRLLDGYQKHTRRRRRKRNESKIREWKKRYAQAVQSRDADAINLLVSELARVAGRRMRLPSA